MKKTIISMALMATVAASSAFAVEPSKYATEAPSKKERHTPQGLYITAENTYKWMQEANTKDEPNNVILVDVRTPAEWQFVGHTHMAQIMIPSVFFKYNAVDNKKPRYASALNNDFISEFENKLDDLGADADTPVVLMCRSGATRAQPAAKMLAQYGYENVYIMTDGFEGGKTKTGEHKGFRLNSGWKVNGHPWTYKVDTANAYVEK